MSSPPSCSCPSARTPTETTRTPSRSSSSEAEAVAAGAEGARGSPWGRRVGGALAAADRSGAPAAEGQATEGRLEEVSERHCQL
eukprot:7507138-Pyramimonas_sp.AAC.1